MEPVEGLTMENDIDLGLVTMSGLALTQVVVGIFELEGHAVEATQRDVQVLLDQRDHGALRDVREQVQAQRLGRILLVDVLMETVPTV